MLDYIKRLWMKYAVRYSNPQEYFNNRWKLNIQSDRWTRELTKTYYQKIDALMKQNQCESILDIGCGAWASLRGLPNYLGLDFSIKALARSGLKEFVFANITNRIPLPDKSYDMVFTRAVLLHIRPENIEVAAKEIQRVAKKCIVLDEPSFGDSRKFQSHNFKHDIAKLFKGYDGEVYHMNWAIKTANLNEHDGHE